MGRGRWVERGALATLWVVGGCGADTPMDQESPLCQPGAAETSWLEEGETVTVTIGCQGELDLDGSALQMTDLPAGAAYDEASATLSWTPGLDQAAVWRLAVEVIDTGELGEVVIGVADAYDAPGNVPVVDPAVYTHEYGVPVLFLDPPPAESDVDEPVTVTYQGRTIAGRGEKRGASSLSYPKNSYLIKFESDAQFYDIERDFVGKRRIVLTSTFDDNVYVRQRLVFDLWNALEPSLPIQAYNVVVFIGGEYWGLYTITDHPSKHWLDSLGLSESGNLYKAFNHDANFRATAADGSQKSTLHQGFEKKLGTPGDFTDMDALVDFAINASDGDFAANIGEHTNLDDYNKWWALVVFTHATDSAGKNSYHYHDSGKWLVAPWDFNASFGQSWETSRLAADSVDMFRSRNEIFRRNLDDAGLGGPFRQLLADAIATGPFSVDALDARVNALIAELDPSARRDWRKWSDDYATHPRWAGRNDMTDYDGELAYLLDWIAARRGHVTSAID